MVFKREKRKWGKEWDRCITHWTVLRNTDYIISNNTLCLDSGIIRKQISHIMQEINPTSTSVLTVQVYQEMRTVEKSKKVPSEYKCKATYKLKNQSYFSRLHNIELPFMHQGVAMKNSFLMQYNLPQQRQSYDIKVVIPQEQDPAGTTKLSWTLSHVGISYRWQNLICAGKGKSNIISLLAVSLCLPHLQGNDTRKNFEVLDFAQITYNGFTLHVNNLRNRSVYQQLKLIYLSVQK